MGINWDLIRCLLGLVIKLNKFKCLRGYRCEVVFLMIMYEECMSLGVDAKALKVGEFYSSTTDYITSYSDS